MSILSNLKPNDGSTKNRKRLGRGQGSGTGQTGGKGGKGQTARSGGRIGRGFEGGQMPLQRRIPKRGFKNIWAVETGVVTLKNISVAFPEGGEINIARCIEMGLVSAVAKRLKVVGTGEINAAYTVHAFRITPKAAEAIEKNGGTVSMIQHHSPYARVKLGEISKKFPKKAEMVTVTVDDLKAAGLVPKYKQKVEVVAVGVLSGKYHVKADKVSRLARQAIENKGGKVTVTDAGNLTRNISFSDLRKWFPKGGDVNPETLKQKGILIEGRTLSLVDKGRLYGVYNVRLHKVSKAARLKL
ncbi:50S ribosomal protein L15, partial [Myxococcota bacterium]|nr:50S ribosomal protein L15 [Myxococcota bacterium]